MKIQENTMPIAESTTEEMQLAAKIIQRIQQDGNLSRTSVMGLLQDTTNTDELISALTNADRTSLSDLQDNNVSQIIMLLCGANDDF